mgnify:CR=1 FL=1
MPYPNEHAARQLDPADFDKLRRGKMEGAPAAISAIFGIKPDGSSALQSVRAAADKMSVGAFREWLKGHDLKDAIEEATGAETMDDDDDDDDEEAKAKADAEKAKNKANKKRGRGGTGGGAGGGNRRYYADPMWGAPYTLTLGEGAQSWVEIVRSGRFFSSSGGREVTLTQDDILSMASTYAQVQSEGWFCEDGAPVGYNHASAHGQLDPESTKAAARVSQVEVRTNDHGGVSLWGLFTWTDDGAARVDAGEFASVSAELLPPGIATSKLSGEKMGGWVLTGATLCNIPMIPGMQRPRVSGTLAASESQPSRIFLSEAPTTTEKPKMSDLIVKLAEATGLPTEAPELLAEVRRLQDEAAKALTLADALETATQEVESLRTRADVLEDREKTRALDEACTLGRIAPTERADYWQIVGTLGEEGAHRIFAEGRVPVERVSSDQAVAEVVASNGADSFIALMDKSLNEGKSSQEAWQIAASVHGSTIYTEEN